MSQAHAFFAKIKSIKQVIPITVGLLSLSIVFLALVAPSASAAADTCTWTGSGADAKISSSGNWTGCDNGHAPQDGDTLVFPTGPTNKTVTVDSDMAFANVTFSGSSYTVSSVGFESFGVYTSLTISGNNNTFNTYLRYYPSATSTFTHSGTGTSFAHYVVIQPVADNTNVIFDTQSDVSMPMIAQTAVGAGSSVDTVSKTGTGTLDISGTAIAGVTASGGIHVKEGTWKCDSTNCLGDSSNVIVLDEGGNAGAATLNLNGNGTFANPITSAAVTGAHGSLVVSANVTLSGNITVSDSLNMFVSGSHTATLSSNIAIASGKLLVFYGVDGYTTNNYVSNGVISGNGGIIVDDAHVTLAGTNTYAGDTEITDTGSGGVLTVTNESGLGSTAGKTIVNSGTTLNFSSGSDQFIGEPLQISGTGVGGSYPAAIVNDNSYRALSGNVVLTGDTTVQNNINELVVFSGQISGDYNLTLVGGVENGSFTVSPPSNNTYKDTIAVGTQLLVYGAAGRLAIPGNLTMNAVDSRTSRIWLQYDNTITDSSVITLNNSASSTAYLLNFALTDTIGTIEGDGTVFMSASTSHFLIGGGSTVGTFNGVVQGHTDSQFEIIDGTWTFSGTNTDVGQGFSSFYVNGGTFIADAADTSLGSSPFSISNSGVLGGTGIIGPVSAYDGIIAPGNSPGCLNPNGDVAFTEFSTLEVQINSTTVCSGYDKLVASGDVFLNDATLDVSLGFNSSKGDVFTIVEGSSVVGTFAGLANGTTFVAGTRVLRINYGATSVTLTDIGSSAEVAASLSSSSAAAKLANTGQNVQLLLLVVLVLMSSGGLLGYKNSAYVLKNKFF